MHKFSKKPVALAAVAALFLGGGVAWAYWTGGGAGSGTVTTKATVYDVSVVQTASTGALAPGESVALSGQLINPNNTDVKVGMLTAVITPPTGTAAADFTIEGGPLLINKVVTKAMPVDWSGLTLRYANSAVNQDNGKLASVKIDYTLTAFQEPPPVPPMPVITYPTLGDSPRIGADSVTGLATLSVNIRTVVNTGWQGNYTMPMNATAKNTLHMYDVDTLATTPVLATQDEWGVIYYYRSTAVAGLVAGHRYQILVKNSTGTVMRTATEILQN